MYVLHNAQPEPRRERTSGVCACEDGEAAFRVAALRAQHR
jgi:hypothetical protein